MEDDLIYIDTIGLKGTNFYWKKYEEKGITKEEILSVGLKDERVLIHEELSRPLSDINDELKRQNYCLYIKEGYRSRDLYKLIYEKRVIKFGKEETDRLLNMKDMPHSTGKSLDAALWDLKEDKEVYMRNTADGTDALFVDFYKDKHDQVSKKYQFLQEKLIKLMQKYGFRLGTKREYFHFDYRPNTPENY